MLNLWDGFPGTAETPPKSKLTISVGELRWTFNKRGRLDTRGNGVHVMLGGVPLESPDFPPLVQMRAKGITGNRAGCRLAV